MKSMSNNQISFANNIQLLLLILDQDEVLFKQFISCPMEWRDQDEKLPMKPKDDGLGILGSGVSSYKIGYGKELLDNKLKDMNHFYHVHRPHYTDKAVTKSILGDALKNAIKRQVIIHYTI
eukprot:1191877-Ditylum_brightwellii.AAC.1